MKFVFVRGNQAEAELAAGTIDAVVEPVSSRHRARRDPVAEVISSGEPVSSDNPSSRPINGSEKLIPGPDYQSSNPKIIRVHIPHFQSNSDVLSINFKKLIETNSVIVEDSYEDRIENAYYEALISLGTTTNPHYERVSLGMHLLLTGDSSWEIDMNLERLLRACIRYTGAHGSLTCGLGMVKELRVYCSESAWSLTWKYSSRRCIAFMEGPLVWDGLGDAKLWHLLMEHFFDPRFDSMGPLDVLVECQREVISITGAPLDGVNHQRFQLELNGRPTVYEASPAVAQLGLPILISNMVDLNMGVYDREKPRFIVETELMRGDDKPTYKLRLPHDMIPLLEGLRGQVQDYTTRTYGYLDQRKRVSLTSYRLRGSRFVVRYTLAVEGSGNGAERYNFDYRCGYSLCAALGCRVSELDNKLRVYAHKHGTRALIDLVKSCMKKWQADNA